MSVGSMDLSGRWIDTLHQRKPLKELILDLDSSVSETYGRQQGTAYNGHFECACYHPLFLFNQFGDLERAMLRRGNHASAKFWRRVLIRSPVGKKYEAVFGESDGECMACWQITAAETTLWWGRRASGRPLESEPRREKQRANWNTVQPSASMEELSLGACPGNAQMGNPGEEDEPPAVNLLPDRYADGKASGLAATITKNGPNTFEFQRE